ncbi:hypothetical protein ACFWOB_34325 [Streptomyces sp. NPDC058420]|uniref:hypothetical protein n=1 Tax=Streptomyces sp. NPDC058420 TaxID=3346489 RepID=UPI00366101B1
MNTQAKRVTGRRLAPLLGVFPGVCLVISCGDGPARSRSPSRQEERARQVADAWRGSASAAAWGEGHHPMDDAVRIPESGWRSTADEQAYETQHFVLRGDLPTTAPGVGKVDWGSGGMLTRPLWGAKLGTATITTTRGPATVPAWLFTLEGYDTPLKRIAVTPSPLPKPPIGSVQEGSGGLRRVTRLTATAKDGRSVTVRATHGSCDDGPVVRVLETDESVVVYASVAGERNGPCNAVSLEQSVKADLRKPLGILLDARTGRPVPYGEANGLSPSWS